MVDFLGYDSVIFTFAKVHSIVPVIVDQLLEQWPNLLMDVECSDVWRKSERIRSAADCLTFIGDDRHSIIDFYRDEEMRQHFEEEGFALDASDEGRITIHFRKRRKILFELGQVNEVSSDNDSIGQVEPYSAILCTPELLEITLATPDNPTEEPFSQQMFRLVLSSI